MPVGEFDYAKKLIPIYFDLFNRAKNLFQEYNPCSVCMGAGIKTCARGRVGGTNFCCSDCKYLGEHGCSVKSLQCQLWVCHYEFVPKETREEFKRKAWAIFIEASRLNLLITRGSEADCIANACDMYMSDKIDRTRGYVFSKPYTSVSEKPKLKRTGFTYSSILPSLKDYVSNSEPIVELTEEVKEQPSLFKEPK